MDISRFLPINEYDAAINANAPTAANPFATIADLIADDQTLSEVLTQGNTMSNGQTITALNGVAVFNPRFLGVDNQMSLYTGTHGSLAVGNESFIDFTPASLGLGHGAAFASIADFGGGIGTTSFGYFGVGPTYSFATASESGASLFVGNLLFTKGGTIQVKQNDTAGWTTFYANEYPSTMSSALLTVSIGVLNSAAIGGKNIKMKTSLSAYANQFVFNTGLAGEMKLVHTPSASDFTATFKAESGTVAYLSDITAADGSIYLNNGTIGSGRVATITDTVTFTGGDFRVQGNTDADLFIVDYSADRVGIGVAAPVRTLDVDGDINNNGFYYQSNVFLIGLRTGGYAAGQNALDSATGTLNTAFGVNALTDLTTGIRNVAIGYEAGGNTVDGQHCTYIGFQAGNPSLTGNSNVAIGSIAGRLVTGGSQNVFLGRDSGTNITGSYSSSIALGFQAWVEASNQMVIGGSSSQITDFSIGYGLSRGSIPASEINMRVTNISAGTTDVAPTFDWVWNASQGTGTGVGSDHVWKVAPAGVTGSAVNPLVEAMRVSGIDGRITAAISDFETLTNTKGFVVLDRTNATRYRIYTDGGVLFTEPA